MEPRDRYRLRSRVVSPLPIRNSKRQKSSRSGKKLEDVTSKNPCPRKKSAEDRKAKKELEAFQRLVKSLDRREKAEEKKFSAEKSHHAPCRRYSEAALSHYNRGRAEKFGKDAPLYELTYRATFAFSLYGSEGPLIHLNFEAKIKDDPEAAPQAMFAQLRSPRGCLIVDCCTRLGPSDSLRDGVDHRVCRYCSHPIYHPPFGCKRLITGSKNEDVRWLHGDVECNSDTDYL